MVERKENIHRKDVRVCPVCGGKLHLFTLADMYGYEPDPYNEPPLPELDDEERIDALNDPEKGWIICVTNFDYEIEAQKVFLNERAGREWRKIYNAAMPRSVPENVEYILSPMRHTLCLRVVPDYPFPINYTHFYTHIFLAELLFLRRNW